MLFIYLVVGAQSSLSLSLSLTHTHTPHTHMHRYEATSYRDFSGDAERVHYVKNPYET